MTEKAHEKQMMNVMQGSLRTMRMCRLHKVSAALIEEHRSAIAKEKKKKKKGTGRNDYGF